MSAYTARPHIQQKEESKEWRGRERNGEKRERIEKGGENGRAKKSMLPHSLHRKKKRVLPSRKAPEIPSDSSKHSIPTNYLVRGVIAIKQSQHICAKC